MWFLPLLLKEVLTRSRAPHRFHGLTRSPAQFATVRSVRLRHAVVVNVEDCLSLATYSQCRRCVCCNVSFIVVSTAPVKEILTRSRAPHSIVRRLERVGDARASAVIQNSESTHYRLRRVYENAAKHHRCMITTGRNGRRH